MFKNDCNVYCEYLMWFIFDIEHELCFILQVVEELLSRSGTFEMETAKGIADAAMQEVANISKAPMVHV